MAPPPMPLTGPAPVPLTAPAASLAESPVWDAAGQALYWTDIPAGRVHRLDAAGRHASWDIGQPVGAIAVRASGGLVLAAKAGFLAFDPESGQVTTLAPVEADQPQNRMNDGACDRAGRFLAGTMALDETPGAGTLYRLDPGHTVSVLLSGLGISNGIGWSPDEQLMYYVDSPTHRVDVFDYDPATGALGGRRPFAAVGAGDQVPDGLTVDADGYVWVAVHGGAAVLRHDPAGRVRQRIDLPAANVTSCAFGGSDGSQLYITTATGPGAGGGQVFTCAPGSAGPPANPCRC